MYNRAEKVDKNFIQRVKAGDFPPALNQSSYISTPLKPSLLVELFESQVLSRHLDIHARELKNSGDSYYTIGSSGHEGNAVFGEVFRVEDMAFLHYRSNAFFIQRAKKLPGSTPTYDLTLSLLASKEDPISGGRHKVIGSKALFIPPQTSTIASHLPKAVGAALSISRAKDLKIEAEMPPDSVIICSFGDASANHSTAVGAINTAAWVAFQNIPLPLVFICEDNGIGISVPTPENWIEQNFKNKPGIKYISCNGLDLFDLYQKSKEAEYFCRRFKKPVFLHMKTVRLLGHAGSDVESTYHSLQRIEATEDQDPLLHSARILHENKILTQSEIIDLYNNTRWRVHQVAQYVKTRPKITDPKETAKTIVACRKNQKTPSPADESERKITFAKEYDKLHYPQHMAKLINWGLTDIMLQHKNALIMGEDVAQKGGVYHVTDNLHKKFGPRRVFNSVLDEQSILGTCIGLAHNGFLPLPEIQFLAYVHNAEDQIRGEAATLAFFSQGQFNNPMVIRIAGLAYQKGFGGHFHNDNSLAVFRDIPGLILAVPSNGEDAVKMLRTCCREAVENGRIAVFIEPIALYMTKDLYEDGDKKWCLPYPSPEQECPLGEFNVEGNGGDLIIISYGNGFYYSLQAAKELSKKHRIKCTVIDLRWLSNINYVKLCETVNGFSKVLIVDECRKTGSLSEEIVCQLVERMAKLPKIKVVAAEDCFIPLGPAAASGLPNKEKIIEAALVLTKGVRR